MSKELEAFYRCCAEEVSQGDYELVETTLKDYDDIKHICNFYDIEFNLCNIREALFTFAQLKGEYGTNWDNYNKKLKALEIIKEKRIDVKCLQDSITLEEYNGTINQRDLYLELTQEEFDLLKEVLL